MTLHYNERMSEKAPRIEPDPVIEAYKKDVDRTLLRENLKRSVDERIQNLMDLQRFLEEMRAAMRRASRK